MPAKVGEVVRVSFTNKTNNQASTVVGVVEAIDVAQGITTVFVGGKQSWRVPASSVAPLALPSSFSWTAADTQKVRATSSADVNATGVPLSPPPQEAPPASSSTKASLLPPLRSPSQPTPSASPAPKVGDVAHAAPANVSALASSSFHGHESYSFEPNAAYTNILCELNARLTGLSTWSSPPLTALFLSVLYLWLAMEGTGVPSWSRTSPLLSAHSVVQRCAIAVARTLLAVLLCTCVSIAPRLAAASTFWLLFPLTVVSFGGLVPVRWWNTLVVVCLPVPLPQQSVRGTAPAAAPAAAPLFLWVVQMVLGGVRCSLRALSRAMIVLGESLRAVSEEIE